MIGDYHICTIILHSVIRHPKILKCMIIWPLQGNSLKLSNQSPCLRIRHRGDVGFECTAFCIYHIINIKPIT